MNSMAGGGGLIKVQWTRCGRTDKGVHASGQVVGLRLLMSDTIKEDINAALPDDVRVFEMSKVTKAFNAKNHCSGRSYKYMLPLSAVAHKDGPEAAIAMLNEILGCYVGTHNYHNFTSKAKNNKKVSSSADEAAKRYMTEVAIKEPCFTVAGVTFLPITISGQSFLFNQIRHMLALALLIYRARPGSSGKGVFARVFSAKEPDIIFPMVPAEFLFLDKCHYEQYQKKVSKSQPDADLSFSAGQAGRDIFIRDVICQEMAELEHKNSIMSTWMNWVYTMDKDKTAFLPIFDVIRENGGALGRYGGSHLPPPEVVLDPITGAAFSKKSPIAQFMHLRHNFGLW